GAVECAQGIPLVAAVGRQGSHHPHAAGSPTLLLLHAFSLSTAVFPSVSVRQEELWSVLKESPWWQRSGGRDHIIPMLQPNALRHIRQRLAPAMFLLLDFGRDHIIPMLQPNALRHIRQRLAPAMFLLLDFGRCVPLLSPPSSLTGSFPWVRLSQKCVLLSHSGGRDHIIPMLQPNALRHIRQRLAPAMFLLLDFGRCVPLLSPPSSLTGSFPWVRQSQKCVLLSHSGGRDHIIPMLQPNALRHIRQRLAPAMFLLLDFGRCAPLLSPPSSLTGSFPWVRQSQKCVLLSHSGGRDHIIPMLQPNALRHIRQRLAPAMFLLLDFGRCVPLLSPPSSLTGSFPWVRQSQKCVLLSHSGGRDHIIPMLQPNALRHIRQRLAPAMFLLLDFGRCVPLLSPPSSLTGSFPWVRQSQKCVLLSHSGGRDHIIPMLQPNALRHIRQRLAPAMFLLLDFGRCVPLLSPPSSLTGSFPWVRQSQKCVLLSHSGGRDHIIPMLQPNALRHIRQRLAPAMFLLLDFGRCVPLLSPPSSLTGSFPWVRQSQKCVLLSHSGGRDLIIPMLQPNALRHIRQRLAPAMFLLLDFGRCAQGVAWLSKDIVVPYNHIAPPYTEPAFSCAATQTHSPNAGTPKAYAQGVARLSKDIVVPYNHIAPPYTEPASYGEAQGPWEARTTLLFFQGTIMRKDVSVRAVRGSMLNGAVWMGKGCGIGRVCEEGYIRKLIFDMYHKEPDVRFVESKITGPQDIISAAEGLQNSRFCLNAAGDTPSSARLFDAIVSHCVPVVISNKIELPFETSIDYSDFTLFVSHEDALRQGYLLRLLRAFPRERWLRMWQNLQHVKHHFEFQYPSQPGDAVSMVWREIRKKLPRVRLAIHRGKRLVVRDWTNV
ncbi:unnamed protein product, partial [Closterium sp. NIES-64]